MSDTMAAGEIAQGRFWKQACLHPVNCPFSLNLTLAIPSETEEMIINVFSWQNVNSWSSFNFSYCISGWFEYFFLLNRNRKLRHGSVSSGGMKVETKLHIFWKLHKNTILQFCNKWKYDRRVTPKHTELQSSSHSLAITLPAISSLNPCLSIKYSWDEWQCERKWKVHIVIFSLYFHLMDLHNKWSLHLFQTHWCSKMSIEALTRWAISLHGWQAVYFRPRAQIWLITDRHVHYRRCPLHLNYMKNA